MGPAEIRRIVNTSLEQAFQARGQSVRKATRISMLGRGYDRTAYLVEVEGAGELARTILVASDPGASDAARRMERETAVLADLVKLALPFRVPRVHAVAASGTQVAMLRDLVTGLSLDQLGAHRAISAVEVTGQTAAAVHAIDVRGLHDGLERHTSRRAHARHCLRVFTETGHRSRLEAELVSRAGEWAAENLPTDGPCTLLHGDLLVHNLIVDPTGVDAPGLIDWEYASVGDPAYDLAVVTRGVRHPFRSANGMKRLLEAYRAAGGHDVNAADVHFYEAGLLARWLLDADDEELREVSASQLRAFLRRVAG